MILLKSGACIVRNRIVLGWVAFTVAVIVAFTADSAEGQPPDIEQVVGSTTFQIWYSDRTDSATIQFGYDLIVHGNILPAGKYTLELFEQSDKTVRVSFSDTLKKETLQLALRSEENDKAEKVRIAFVDAADGAQPLATKGNVPKKPTTAEVMIEWAGRSANMHFRLKGVRRRSTPAPDVPARFAEPWFIVESSLNALLDEDLKKHIENFTDDFKSGLVFGHDVDSHSHYLDQTRIRGGLEGALLALDGLEWREENDTFVFGGIVFFASTYELPFTYKVELRGDKWKVTHIGLE